MDDHDHRCKVNDNTLDAVEASLSHLFLPFCCICGVVCIACLIAPSTESSSVVEQSDTVNKVSSAEALTAAVNSKIVGKIVAIEVEGCEYLYAFNPGNGFNVFTHKGNCKNPVHLYNKEKE
jgi:hypothetical protein